jgi:thiamine biosynthesis lipoprotein
VRILVGPATSPDAPDPEFAAIGADAFLRDLHRRLTRFDPASELSRLNADPRPEVEVSPTLASALEAARWAAERSGGLVDPTLLTALEAAGYEDSRAGCEPGPLSEAIAASPSRRAAAPATARAWRRIEVNRARGIARRPPGVRLDLGGSAKGLAADLAVARLGAYETCAVDAGGDISIGGARPRPRRIDVDHPLLPGNALTLELATGAVATSGLRTRVWRRGGRFAHHLIDPATGAPAWTGVIQATALAHTALEAEVLAKSALLAGPERGVEMLEPCGGVLVLDDGEAITAGDLPVLEMVR